MLEARQIQCPYCGDTIDAQVDCSAGSHRYIEDCPVCCCPIEYEAEIDADGRLCSLMALRDDDG
ncbi:CPXCG motif-containing cysteine-rich protein [Thiohalocapsa marina]|uniref:CPXCG motif-containing cysteine-rich protein n=1 Tax=Thiohalocapsa marina TaxID=424902 RepID=A0A5M8FEN7_9GAMM|nr:CPXCG motif-containing cysteine-rich protein [Thiohalocapsa marina]KAA6181511.1 CPXCG motif-containing cysteine-rich protein [Thiohalocapsa marina]